MNFFSTLCLIHPPQKLSQLRGHYTQGNTLFARSGTKKLSDFHFKIEFNHIFFQQQELYSNTISQLLKVTHNNQTSTMLVFTSNENYRFEILKELIFRLREDQKVYLLDYKILKRGELESIEEVEDETKDLQLLTDQTLDLFHSQVKNRRSMNSIKISLKVVGGGEQFMINILQVNLSNSKDTEIIHRQFKQLFQEGIVDEEEFGTRSKEINESNNIFLLTYLTFEEKKRIQEQCYMEFLSRIEYSSEVQKIKQNKKTQSLITQLTILRENRQKMNQQIGFFCKVRQEIDKLVGKQLKIIRKLNIKFNEIRQYKDNLKKGMKTKIKQIQVYKQKLKKLQSVPPKQNKTSKQTTEFLSQMKGRLKAKLQSLNSTNSQIHIQNQNPTRNIHSAMSYNSGSFSRIDLNQSTTSKSTTYTRPRSALRTKYLDMSKTIIMKQNSKIKSLVDQLEIEEHNLIESKRQEINTLSQLTELYTLMKEMSQSSRSKFIVKYGL